MKWSRLSIRDRFILLCGMLSLCSFVVGGVWNQRWIHSTGTARIIAWSVVALLVVTLVGSAIGYRVTQGIRRRLYDIEEAASLIAGGRLHHRIQSNGNEDEIERLVDQFNTMGRRIEEQVGALQQMATENFEYARQAEQTSAIEERQRLARDLHDSVSQDLFSLTLLSAAANQAAAVESSNLSEILGQIETLANHAQREMRALLLQLRPIELEGRSFGEAVEGFLTAVGERYGLQCSYRAETKSPYTPVFEEQLFRIVQEAVANVFKHAQATQVVVMLTEQSSFLELTVTDDGKGLPNAPTGTKDAYGLTAMRERAIRLGGELTLLRREQGTTVRAIIPIRHIASEDHA